MTRYQCSLCRLPRTADDLVAVHDNGRRSYELGVPYALVCTGCRRQLQEMSHPVLPSQDYYSRYFAPIPTPAAHR